MRGHRHKASDGISNPTHDHNQQEKACRQRLKRRPESLEDWIESATLLSESAAHGELLKCIEDGLLANGPHPELMLLQASALVGLERWEEARETLESARELAPGSSRVLKALAGLLLLQGDNNAAIDTYSQALERDPDSPLILLDRGLAHARSNRFQEARQDLDRAISLASDDEEVIGTFLRAVIPPEDPVWEAIKGKPLKLSSASNALLGCMIVAKTYCLQDGLTCEEKITLYQQALQLEPSLHTANLNLARELRNAWQHTAAIAIAEKLLQQNANNIPARYLLSGCLSDLGQPEAAVAQMEIALSQNCPAELQLILLQSLLFLQQTLPENYAPPAYDLIRIFSDQLITRAGFRRDSLPPRAFRQRPQGAALRVGFVSGDLHEHPVGLMLSCLLDVLDPQRITPLLYSNRHRPDWLQRKLRLLSEACGGGMQSLVNLNDQQAASLIINDGIDILIDLAGHTDRNRLGLFIRRPSPVQISWLGYFATTGLPSVDYIILDRWHHDANSGQVFSERILHLDPNRFCFAPIPQTPPVFPLPMQHRGQVSFGSFNNSFKLNHDTLHTWRRILCALPQSRLILKYGTLQDPAYGARIHGFFAEAGIDAERIELRGISRHHTMLAQYGDLDIALDPFPYCGGYTSLEALWMGVPVITLPGRRVVSRQTLSFLACIDALELVARDQDHYVQLAVELASDPQRLQAYREQLRPRMAASPLCQPKPFADQFTTLLEQAYATIQAEHSAAQA